LCKPFLLSVLKKRLLKNALQADVQ